MKRKALAFCVMLLTIAITGCMGSKSASSSGRGGEVVGGKAKPSERRVY